MLMKRFTISSLFVVSVCCLSMLSSCQIAEVVIRGTTYYDTEITMKDGRLITGRIGGQRSSQLASASKTISIKTDEGRQKIKSEQIKYMKLARKGHPEKQQTLVFTKWKIPYTKKGKAKELIRENWQAVYSAGDHLIITACGHAFSIDKNGALIVSFSRDEGIKYCILRAGDECPIYIGSSTYAKKSMRKVWMNYLSDDAELCRKIENKEIDSFNFDVIAEQYNPQGK